jgi:hypothetical protein
MFDITLLAITFIATIPCHKQKQLDNTLAYCSSTCELFMIRTTSTCSDRSAVNDLLVLHSTRHLSDVSSDTRNGTPTSTHHIQHTSRYYFTTRSAQRKLLPQAFSRGRQQLDSSCDRYLTTGLLQTLKR